jgi:hypothetical protein
MQREVRFMVRLEGVITATFDCTFPFHVVPCRVCPPLPLASTRRVRFARPLLLGHTLFFFFFADATDLGPLVYRVGLP